jgi:hypothetical protein
VNKTALATQIETLASFSSFLTCASANERNAGRVQAPLGGANAGSLTGVRTHRWLDASPSSGSMVVPYCVHVLDLRRPEHAVAVTRFFLRSGANPCPAVMATLGLCAPMVTSGGDHCFLPPIESFCRNQSTLASDLKAHGDVFGAPS